LFENRNLEYMGLSTTDQSQKKKVKETNFQLEFRNSENLNEISFVMNLISLSLSHFGIDASDTSESLRRQVKG